MVCVFVHMWGDPHRGQGTSPDLLDVGIQIVVSCFVWVLGTELGFPGRAPSALKHLARSPVSSLYFYSDF